MSLTIHRPGQVVPAGGLAADRELCLDRSQTRLVEAGSVESAWVLIGKGQTIPAAEVQRLGLTRWSDGRVMQGPEPMPMVAPEPLADVVRPAGAMQEPKRSPKRGKAQE